MQIAPPGFHILFLPFAEELRKIDVGETTKGEHIVLQ